MKPSSIVYQIIVYLKSQYKLDHEACVCGLVGISWKRKALQELHEKTSFTAFELDSMLNHFREEHCPADDKVDRDAFRRMVTHGTPTAGLESSVAKMALRDVLAREPGPQHALLTDF